jgi:hypothetical protein
VHALVLERGLALRGRFEVTPETKRNAAAYFAGALVFDLGVLALYLCVFAGQSSPAMKAFWFKHFLDVTSLESILRFAWRGLLGLPFNAVSPWFALLYWPLIVGIRATLLNERLRPLAWGFGLLFLLQLMAATLQVYPMGEARTGLFSYPIFWIITAIGADSLIRSASSSAARRGWLQLAAASVVIAALCRPSVEYSDVRDRQDVEHMLELFRPSDGLLMHHFGLLALAYYGARPSKLIRSNVHSHGFEAWPDYPNLFVLPLDVDGVSLRSRPELADASLETLYGRGYQRLLFLSTHMTPAVDQHVLEDCEKHGYYETERFSESPRAMLYVLTRTRQQVPAATAMSYDSRGEHAAEHLQVSTPQPPQRLDAVPN